MKRGIIFFFFLFSFPVLAAEGIPFTSQAPFGDWDDARQQEGCEEASMIMAMAWVWEESLSKEEALQQIIDFSQWEQQNLGWFEDTSAKTSYDIFKEYFEYDNIELKYDITSDDIIFALEKGHVVLAPMNGRALHNPHFTAPGPQYHMIVFFDYKPLLGTFVTHDPGTRYGANYLYSYDTINNALRDYPDGSYEKLEEERTAMIVVKKEKKEEIVTKLETRKETSQGEENLFIHNALSWWNLFSVWFD